MHYVALTDTKKILREAHIWTERVELRRSWRVSRRQELRARGRQIVCPPRRPDPGSDVRDEQRCQNSNPSSTSRQARAALRPAQRRDCSRHDQWHAYPNREGSETESNRHQELSREHRAPNGKQALRSQEAKLS